MKEEILKLRSEGKSYREINKILGCSKGTIAYHCGSGQKEKTNKRSKKSISTIKYKLYNKIDLFVSRETSKKGILKYIKRTDEHKKFYDKIINNPFCYLTGEEIDLSNSKSYHLDHIIPVSKCGDNSLENMGLLKSDVNQAKSHMSKDEFINLCRKICEYNN